MIIKLKPKGTSGRPIKKDIEVEIKGPCDTGGIVSTMAGVVLGTISRTVITGGIEIEVERSVYEKYRKEGWTYA